MTTQAATTRGPVASDYFPAATPAAPGPSPQAPPRTARRRA